MRVLAYGCDLIEMELTRLVDGKPFAVIVAVPPTLKDDADVIEVEVNARLTELLTRQYGPGKLVKGKKGMKWMTYGPK